MKQSNIVIFNPDQMRADALGHLGNPAAITPNLDAFAKNESVSFRNAYCQNPVCVPSRCSFLTGLYPHVYGNRTMHHMLGREQSSIFSELKEAGYYVWMNGRNDFLPAQVEDIFEKHSNEVHFNGKRPIVPCHYEKEQPKTPEDKGYYSFYKGKLVPDSGEEVYSRDDETMEGALEFIERADKNQPFCMFVGLENPHPPYEAEEPYFSAIQAMKLPKRIPTPEDLNALPAMLRGLIENFKLQDFSEEDWDAVRTCYLAMCMKVDTQFGQLCDALKKAGIYDDTDIYFFSDHGDFTGDYGVPEKAQNVMKDCLVNVPLLIKPHKGIEIDPGITDSLVELVDFYATAMDLAGVIPDHTQFGRSLRPILKDRNAKVRTCVFSEGGRLQSESRCCSELGGNMPDEKLEYYPRLMIQETDGVAHGKTTMIRTKEYKYVRHLYEQDEFYDLKKDPTESHNVIENPEYSAIILELSQSMLSWYQETCDIVPYSQDSRFNMEILWNIQKRRMGPDMTFEGMVEMMHKVGMK